MKDIFFTDQDELTGRFVVVDEQENAIWAYLTLPYEEKIDKSCFLGSRIKIESKKLIWKNIKADRFLLL